MSGVDRSLLTKYIELEKQIQQLECGNPIKEYEVRKKAADDVEETIKETEITLQQLILQTKKEKADVDNMDRKSIGDIFKTEADFNSQLSIEQEEYLEAKNKEEVARQTIEDLKLQKKELIDKANEVKGPADHLTKLFGDRDQLLSDIFGGEYGSEKENFLEAQFDSLMEKKQRVEVAKYKWTNGRILLKHAVNQMVHAENRWKELPNVSVMQEKYVLATEVRNNLIAAIQNVTGTQKYLNTIEFPYCKPAEVETLKKATANIYADMATTERHRHAFNCYSVTRQRAGALLQWFDMVIDGTILKDLAKVTEEARKVEKDLRAERIKLIRDKVAESGGDVQGLNDAVSSLSSTNQQKLSDEDMDMKGIGVTRPAPVDDRDLPDQKEPDRPTPTPLPLSELAPTPSDTDLFGDITQLKQEFAKNIEDYQKAQELNKARMEQGLQEKLAARRHKKK